MDLLAQTWMKIYNYKDPNIIVGIINELFTETLDLHAPSVLKVKQDGAHDIKLS